MEEEGGARKSPRRSSRILSDVGTSNQKVYRRSRMRGQVSSPTDEVNDCPNFSLGISQESGEQNKASTSKKIVDYDDDFEDLAPQFQSKKLKNKDGPEKKKPVKDAKTRNRLPKNVILPESRYPDNEYQISNRDFYLVESGQFNSYPWGLDVYKKLSDSVRHELKSTHKYYRLGGLPLALQIWIFECCSKVDEDIAIRVADSIPRILNWKTIAESPWQKYVEKCLFMPTKNKFENIVASEDEVSKFRLPEPRDYNAEILKLEPKGSSHGLDMLTNEVIELRKELVKVSLYNCI
ncbi:hypothetical protein H5410_054356 [Solanum commersonii]|uniref:Uncharacterized protein n=1 Tax=Solanum commersonii TaxID=4109 RepID=A0A9J5WHA3_SOLCO|nr:hypothetical protein H5410_054356 [Solanum commersonii]